MTHVREADSRRRRPAGVALVIAAAVFIGQAIIWLTSTDRSTQEHLPGLIATLAVLLLAYHFFSSRRGTRILLLGIVFALAAISIALQVVWR